MKNILFYALLSSFCLMTNFSLANTANYSEQNLVIEADCHMKTGAVVSFQIPEKYLDKKGQLTQPIQVALLKNGNKKAVYTAQSMTLQINIPVHVQGDYVISIQIGNHFTTKKISIN